MIKGWETIAVQQMLSAQIIPVKEVPIPLVRSNQWMLILATLVAVTFQAPWLIVLVFALTLFCLLFGQKYNPAIFVAKLVLSPGYLVYAHTESLEIQRFNQIIAVTFLGLSSLSFAIFGSGFWLMWLFSSLITVAAGCAVFGYCIGCKIYFPYKKATMRWRRKFPKLNILFDFMSGSGRFKTQMKKKPLATKMMGLCHDAIRHAMEEVRIMSSPLKTQNVKALIQKIADINRCVTLHAQQEDECYYPPFERKHTGITDVFYGEHVDFHENWNYKMIEILKKVQPSDAESLQQAQSAVNNWLKYNEDHLLHEEIILSPHMPKVFNYEEAIVAVRDILQVRTEEFEQFQLPFIIKYLKPGQQYHFINILQEVVEPEKFQLYESIVKPLIPTKSWSDFTNVGRAIGE